MLWKCNTVYCYQSQRKTKTDWNRKSNKEEKIVQKSRYKILESTFSFTCIYFDEDLKNNKSEKDKIFSKHIAMHNDVI